jgi:hypothetical protein
MWFYYVINIVFYSTLTWYLYLFGSEYYTKYTIYSNSKKLLIQAVENSEITRTNNSGYNCFQGVETVISFIFTGNGNQVKVYNNIISEYVTFSVNSDLKKKLQKKLILAKLKE